MEISEVLFNELAFFKLMQDLDNNSISVKQRCKRKIETTEVVQSYAKEVCFILFLKNVAFLRLYFLTSLITLFYTSSMFIYLFYQLLCNHSIACVGV